MSKQLKLHVLLALTEQSGGSYKKLLEDFVQFFKNKQGDFKGVKKTYDPRPGTVDLPSMRDNKQVVTTVGEKLQWLEEFSAEHINNLFSVEATNASGGAKAELVVDGISFGMFSSMELLRLKDLIKSGVLEGLYQNIPVRSDAEIWIPTTNEQYTGREIFESPAGEGIQKSTTKESYILEDPNVDKLKDASSYKPQIAQRDHHIELGDYTYQTFSGEYSTRQKAEILTRRTRLLSAVTEALKVANEAPIVESALTAEKIFGYLHRGKI